MELHPVPQNVTKFQFKLVGDMTLKQFIYLASGAVVAYLIFIVIVPDYPLFGWPFVLLFTAGGAAFAFLPIRARPLDQWILSFFKAVYSPTQRVWVKDGRSFKNNPLFNSRYIIFTSGTGQTPKKLPSNQEEEHPEEAKQSVVDTAPLIKAAPPATPTPVPPSQAPAPYVQTPPAKPSPTLDELKKTVELAREAQDLKLKIIQAEKVLGEIKNAASKPSAIPVDYTYEANKIVTDLKNLVTHASDINHKLDEITHNEEAESLSLGINPPKIIKITPQLRPKQQLALTSFPNVINGIVKDRFGNYLEGVIAVIYDKEGLPVRALKTNKLGQFFGSTPLSNGVYMLELEKDNFNFDILQIELSGQVLPPLIITAKEVTVS